MSPAAGSDDVGDLLRLQHGDGGGEFVTNI